MESGTRILVVQDDPVMLGLVSGSLRPEGFILREVGDPLEALTIASVERDSFDLIISRVESQPITGLELAKRLAAEGINLPVLFICKSHAMAAVISGSFGPSAILLQPFSGTELRTAVKRCLNGPRRKHRRIA